MPVLARQLTHWWLWWHFVAVAAGPCAQKMCTVNAQRTPHCPFCRGLLEDFCANEPVLRRRRARAVLQQQQQRQA